MSFAQPTEWTPWEGPEPEPVPECPTGIMGHRWAMNVEEGQPYFALADGEECPPHDFGDGAERQVCPWHLADFICNDPSMVEMRQPVTVSVKFVTEQYADDDFAVWIEATPEATP